MARWLITYNDEQNGNNCIVGAVDGTAQEAANAALAQAEQDLRLYRLWKHAAKIEVSGDFSIVQSDGEIEPTDGE